MSRHYADQLIAHRGYALQYPENSLPGVAAAMAAGARFIEVDIQLSADGVPVLFHDRDLQRLCARPGAIHEYNWTQLADFSIFSPTPTNDAALIPSLAQLVELIKPYPGITLFVELKRLSLVHWGEDAVIAAVLKELQPVLKQCVIISYSIAALSRLRKSVELPIGYVSDRWQDLGLPEVKTLAAEYLFCNIDSLPDSGPLAISSSIPGSRLAVYECADPDIARELFARGVDLVETFAFAEMREALTDIEHG